MAPIKLNIRHLLEFITREEIDGLQEQVTKHLDSLLRRNGRGSDFLGWLDLTEPPATDITGSILETAARIRSMSEVFVVVGIGGSYLGARAVIEALSHHFAGMMNTGQTPQIVFAGQNISEDYMANLLEVLDRKDYSMAIISKSGTTTEPAIAFRLLRRHIEEKYGRKEAARRIIAITDPEKGALRAMADHEGYITYEIPGDVGGRYSVLSPVGLIPIAVAGQDILKILDGAGSMRGLTTRTGNLDENPAVLYAVIRNLLYQRGMLVEILVSYEPALHYFSEWWKQLLGESEGKEGKGIFPASVDFTTDLHSLGQYIQEGKRILFETVLDIEHPVHEVKIAPADDDSDGLNYLAGMRLHEVNRMARWGTVLAHVDGGVPNLVITVPDISEKSLGALIFFFEMACALSGYLLDVNPFDQPGVEMYKRNMFSLLGKPGFEKETLQIRKRL
ncbi:MAG: glucose-6-phosphate isomerase [Bacteroidales bacterium]|nr:glucose-6-phosphate isomerase [Bacteroidales bacterium]